MKVLNEISAEMLTKTAKKWAKLVLPPPGKDKELDELLEETFIGGFIAGAIQIRDVVERAEKDFYGL